MNLVIFLFGGSGEWAKDGSRPSICASSLRPCRLTDILGVRLDEFAWCPSRGITSLLPALRPVAWWTRPRRHGWHASPLKVCGKKGGDGWYSFESWPLSKPWRQFFGLRSARAARTPTAVRSLSFHHLGTSPCFSAVPTAVVLCRKEGETNRSGECP
jgi:hypothetical protein